MSDDHLRVLLVDDDEEDALLTKELLAESEHERFLIDWVATYEAAVEAIARDSYDVCLVDYYLGVHNGLDVLRSAHESECRSPIIMLTGLDNREVDVEAMREGAADYLVKNQLTSELLERTIRYTIQRTHTEEALQKAHDELELRVQERTAEIVRANVLLQNEITERRHAEEALRENEGRLRAIVNTAADGILTIDATGHIESCNPAAESIFGYTADEITGQAGTALIPDFAALQLDTQTKESRGSQLISTARSQDSVGQRKDGVSFPLDLSIGAVEIDNHRIATLIVRDRTERQELESQLALARKLESIGELAAGIAHEINTPMQYIGDNTRFLQDAFQDMGIVMKEHLRLLSASKEGRLTAEVVAEVEAVTTAADLVYLTEEVPHAVQQSLQGIERVNQIVRAMKEFSHPGGGEKKAIDLNRAIETTITVARNEWKYVAEMKTDFDQNLPAVPCLPGELNQVVLNLIVNAVHAITERIGDGSSEKGTITLQTCVNAEWVEIHVRDTGNGIPEGIRAKIFDPFFTTKEVGKGTGQGLSIARSVIVDKHGGTLTFETALGQGTTFIIRLPLGSKQRQSVAA